MVESILMIEDDKGLGDMVAEYLSSSGFQVEVKPSGVEGLSALERKPFAALILDVMLPDIDGFEVCRRVRADSDIPILMLTARGEEYGPHRGAWSSALMTTFPNRSTLASF